MVDNAARVPLFEDPGTRFRYGIFTTVLNRLVEVVSKQPLEQFLQERIFEPLGMTDTVFWATGERAERLATVYRPSPEGALRPYAIEDVPFTQRPALTEDGVGWLSTVREHLRFSQMFLNEGELNGHRVLRAETVEMMTANRIPEARFHCLDATTNTGGALGSVSPSNGRCSVIRSAPAYFGETAPPEHVSLSTPSSG